MNAFDVFFDKRFIQFGIQISIILYCSFHMEE
jgi:hypothetical protein